MESEALSLDDEGKASTVQHACVRDGDGAARGAEQNSSAK